MAASRNSRAERENPRRASGCSRSAGVLARKKFKSIIAKRSPSATQAMCSPGNNRECQISPRPRGEEFHLEAPIGIGDGIAEVAYGEPETHTHLPPRRGWTVRTNMPRLAPSPSASAPASTEMPSAPRPGPSFGLRVAQGSTARRRPGQRIGAPPPGAAPTSFPRPVTASSWLSRSSP
jgi:hypothetical protein